MATAFTTGSSGTATSVATTAGTGVIAGMSATSAATFATGANSASLANIGGSFYTFNSNGTFGTNASQNDIAFMTGLPNANSVNSVLNANSNLAAKLGTAQALVFGDGVMGEYDASSNGSQTYNSTNAWTLNSASLTGHLILGFSSNESFGTGFTSLALTVSVGGTVVITQNFTTLASAQAYFNNDALDLGVIAASSSLAVTVSTSLVTSTLGAGFAEEYLLGATGGNGPPVLTAPASKTVAQSVATAIGGLNLTETGNTSGETFTVVLADTNGKLTATGTGITGSGTTQLTLTGTLAAVQADLSTVAINDATAGSDTVTLNATDSLGGTAAAVSVAVAVNGAPVLTAPRHAQRHAEPGSCRHWREPGRKRHDERRDVHGDHHGHQRHPDGHGRLWDGHEIPVGQRHAGAGEYRAGQPVGQRCHGGGGYDYAQRQR